MKTLMFLLVSACFVLFAVTAFDASAAGSMAGHDHHAAAAPAPAPATAPAAAAPTKAFTAPQAVGAKAICPVTGETFDIKADTLHSEYKGKHVYFCCPGCKPKFDANPDKFLTPAPTR